MTPAEQHIRQTASTLIGVIGLPVISEQPLDLGRLDRLNDLTERLKGWVDDAVGLVNEGT